MKVTWSRLSFQVISEREVQYVYSPCNHLWGEQKSLMMVCDCFYVTNTEQTWHVLLIRVTKTPFLYKYQSPIDLKTAFPNRTSLVFTTKQAKDGFVWRVWRVGVTVHMSIGSVSVMLCCERLLIVAWRRSRGVTALKENFRKLTSHILASVFKEDVVMCGQTVRVMVRLELVIVFSLNSGTQEEACH